MKSLAMEHQQPVEGTERRRARVRWVGLLVLLLMFSIAIAVVWRLLLPETSVAATGALTERDKREIAQRCRQYTIKFAVDRLRQADFGWFAHSVNVLFRQRISRFIDNHDGTYRVYVVVYDQKEPDGFYAWSRHQFVKTNGYWTILRSY